MNNNRYYTIMQKVEERRAKNLANIAKGMEGSELVEYYCDSVDNYTHIT
jgi:hypothetical protein